MINIMKMKMAPIVTKDIAIPANDPLPYNVIVMSENDSFKNFFTKLNIRRQFVKRISMVAFKNPQILATMKSLIPYKDLGLIPVLIPGHYNTYFDTSDFFNIIDKKFGKQSYKRSIVFQKIIAYFNKIKEFGKSKTVLIYHVNLNKEIPQSFYYRRSSILSLLAEIGDGTLPFDSVVIAIEKSGTVKFTSIFNKDQKPIGYQKINSILKRLVSKPEETEDVDSMDETIMESMNIINENEEKDSILRFIYAHQKKKVLIS